MSGNEVLAFGEEQELPIHPAADRSGPRLSRNASVPETPIGAIESVEMDEEQASASARWAPASLLVLWSTSTLFRGKW